MAGNQTIKEKSLVTRVHEKIGVILDYHNERLRFYKEVFNEQLITICIMTITKDVAFR